MSKMPLFFIIVVAIIVIAASFRFVQQRREKADNDAAMTNKREKPLNDRRSRQQQVTPAGTTMRYEASFKPETGGLEMTFRLEAQQYHQLTVGEKGMLSYKGSRFEGFAPER